MRTKRRAFAFDLLEDRRLLSVAPLRQPAVDPVSLGYVSGPIVRATAAPSIAAGYEPPAKPAPTTPQLGVALMGQSVNSVGGGVTVMVQDSNPDWKMTHVEISASGAIKSTQTLGAVVGHSDPFTGFEADYTFGTDVAGTAMFWNDQPGTKTVTVSATYNDTAHTVLHRTATIVVGKPVVADTILTGYPLRVGKAIGPNNVLDPNRFGLLAGGPSASAPGIAFTADVTSRPSSGEFGFVQFVTYLRYEEESAVSLRETTVPGGFWVDCPVNAPEPELNGIWSTAQAGSTQFIVPNRTDAPGVFSKLSDIPVIQNRATRFYLAASFETYLVWHPTGGGYVAVDKIAWDLQGTATYNCDLNDPNAATQYVDPNNWTVTSNHDDLWQQAGDKTVKLLEYTNNANVVKSTSVTYK